jgi:hypothetical protein
MSVDLFANITSTEFAWNAIDTVCCLLLIPFQSGSREQTRKGVFCFEDCLNFVTVSSIVIHCYHIHQYK